MANGTPGTPQNPLTVIPGGGWLSIALQAITTVGLPTVFACVLLWFVLTRIDTALKVIGTQEEDRTKIVAAMQDSLVNALDRQSKLFSDAIDRNIAANRDISYRVEQAFNARPYTKDKGNQ